MSATTIMRRCFGSGELLGRRSEAAGGSTFVANVLSSNMLELRRSLRSSAHSMPLKHAIGQQKLSPATLRWAG